ncbi:hypothetical protein [Rhodanobacter sp. L36]|uniref:hypothetical protein n=1 Tax=Rhodanobacter sp. L36 TaxID=1747221 RepID=UPI00131DE274|nr:hypothetical protein [Rhodanobacter sp. L36]
MKLLRDFIRLRAAGRRLLSARHDSRGARYAVTVPQPLHRPATDVTQGHASMIAVERAAIKSSPSHTLCLVSSR